MHQAVRKNRGSNPLKNVDINLGRACNNRCVFCSNGAVSARERGWMRSEEVEQELDARRREGYTSVGFLGGEPTLYPRIRRLIRQARERGYRRISLCTNGSRLADAVFLEELLDEGLTRVAFSIHSHRATIEDAITRRKGSFEEKLRAIDNLVDAVDRGRLPDGFSINAVLHRKILKSLDTFVRFFHRRGVGDIRFNFIRPEHQAVGSRAWVPSFKETTPRVEQLIVLNQTTLGMHLSFADFPLCKLPWSLLSNPEWMQRYVGESRDLITEVTLYRPPSSGGTRRFNWKDQRTSYLKCMTPSCSGCVLRDRCEGVWQGYLDIYGVDEFTAGPAMALACTVDSGTQAFR